MIGHSGFRYFYELLSMNESDYRLHYTFNVNSGTTIPNGANFPNLSGLLSFTGNFYSNSGSGNFNSGQRITVQSQTGISSEFWSHIFITEKTNSGKGVLIDSSKDGTIKSGYLIGYNDNNRLYLESYNRQGPLSLTSSTILGKKNIAAVVKTTNNISFYVYDFNLETIFSDSFPVDGDTILSSEKLIIGNPSPEFSFAESAPFTGFIDEYVYLQDALTPFNFRMLCSGLVSDYYLAQGTVTTYSGIEVTGYQTTITGVTGITGFANVITGSGLNPFGTGDYDYFYTTSGITGFLITGGVTRALTGYVPFYITGDSTPVVSLRTGYISGFYLDQITNLINIDSTDILVNYSINKIGANINLVADYDLVEGKMRVSEYYDDTQIHVYLNGISNISTGYNVTGNIYGSGIVLSGDYSIIDLYLESTGFYETTDVIIYDEISGYKTRNIIESAQSGSGVNVSSSNNLVFLNGQLMVSGLNYTGNGSQIRFINDTYQGVSGAIQTFNIPEQYTFTTGEYLQNLRFFRRNNLMFLNGQRREYGRQYVENSIIDLIGNSGIFSDNLSTIFSNEVNDFEIYALAAPDTGDYLTIDSTFFSIDSSTITIDQTLE